MKLIIDYKDNGVHELKVVTLEGHLTNYNINIIVDDLKNIAKWNTDAMKNA